MTAIALLAAWTLARCGARRRSFQRIVNDLTPAEVETAYYRDLDQADAA